MTRSALNFICSMNNSKNKKLALLLSIIAALETVTYFFLAQQQQHAYVRIKTRNSIESNIDFEKDVNITELDLKLHKKLKEATNKKVSTAVRIDGHAPSLQTLLFCLRWQCYFLLNFAVVEDLFCFYKKKVHFSCHS